MELDDQADKPPDSKPSMKIVSGDAVKIGDEVAETTGVLVAVRVGVDVEVAGAMGVYVAVRVDVAATTGVWVAVRVGVEVAGGSGVLVGVFVEVGVLAAGVGVGTEEKL